MSGFAEIFQSVLDPTVYPDVPLTQSTTIEDHEVWARTALPDGGHGWAKVVTLSKDAAIEYAHDMNTRPYHVAQQKVFLVYEAVAHVTIYRREVEE